jgi:hypothetical protein
VRVQAGDTAHEAEDGMDPPSEPAASASPARKASAALALALEAAGSRRIQRTGWGLLVCGGYSLVRVRVFVGARFHCCRLGCAVGGPVA